MEFHNLPKRVIFVMQASLKHGSLETAPFLFLRDAKSKLAALMWLQRQVDHQSVAVKAGSGILFRQLKANFRSPGELNFSQVSVASENVQLYHVAASQSRWVGISPSGKGWGCAGFISGHPRQIPSGNGNLQISDLARASHPGSVDFALVLLVAADSLGDVKQHRRDQYHSGDRDRAPLHWLVAC